MYACFCNTVCLTTKGITQKWEWRFGRNVVLCGVHLVVGYIFAFGFFSVSGCWYNASMLHIQFFCIYIIKPHCRIQCCFTLQMTQQSVYRICTQTVQQLYNSSLCPNHALTLNNGLELFIQLHIKLNSSTNHYADNGLFTILYIKLSVLHVRYLRTIHCTGFDIV